MPRVKNGVAHHARKKKIMEAAKGARGGRSKLYKAAKETAERAMRYAYRDRRKKKSEFRALWITRINVGADTAEVSRGRRGRRGPPGSDDVIDYIRGPRRAPAAARGHLDAR